MVVMASAIVSGLFQQGGRKMKSKDDMVIDNPLGSQYDPLVIPKGAYVVHMNAPQVFAEPALAIKEALEHPIASESLAAIARKKKASCGKEHPTVALVVSDNTRPVPYKGEEGILLPILEVLFAEGYRAEEITILIATGTHRAMTEPEIRGMIDSRILDMGIKVINHDCRDEGSLVHLGDTRRGTKVLIDRNYVDADLKIATGLVESHFMAGASGGRKAICPGLIGEQSTYVFHGAELMADRNSRDLNLEGNPVHAESLEVAKMATVDFLVNVTLDHAFHITGIFCGDLEQAHLAAVEKIKGTVGVSVPKAADIVVTHGGFVGINHYQTAKCAVASLGILKKDGWLVIVADTTDEANVVGAVTYRTTLALLKLVGSRNFLRTICSSDWTFIPDQWQVQQWAKVFDRIPMDHMIFYSPKLDRTWWPGIPGIDGHRFLSEEEQAHPGKDCFAKVVISSLSYIEDQTGRSLDTLQVAYVSEGPYVIPRSEEPVF